MSGFTDEHRAPTAITAANPVVVTSPDHGLVDGQRVRSTQFTLATGMYELNNRLFIVWFCTTNTFALMDLYGQPIDGSTYTAYVSGGQFTLTGPALYIVNEIE